jgi:serine protease Do
MLQDRGYGFVALLAVIGVSIVFGMILGGKLNAPGIALAAPEVAASPMQLAPASTVSSPVLDFADIVERSLPAVVAVTSTHLHSDDGGGDDDGGGSPGPESHPFFNDPFFRRFFGDPQDRGDTPSPHPRIGEGSGFVISPDGFILTNHHVVEDSDVVDVTLQSGKAYRATVVGADPSIDLALLKIDTAGAALPTLALGDSGSVRVGEWVIAIGNPLDFDQTVTVGVVSGKGRRVPLGSTDFAVVAFLQTDAAINFGNSGGPLLDARGNVIGINTAINRQFLAEGIGFALPINQARAVVEQLRERGFVRRGFIGITMNRNGLDDAAREFYGLPDAHGVIISAIQENGPGERAGLQPGDVIRKVDGEQVEDNFDLVSKIAGHEPGDEVRLEVFRKPSPSESGRTVKVPVTLADREEGMASLGGGERRERPEAPPEREVHEAHGLGLTVETLDDALRSRLGLESDQTGVIVTDVKFGSPAASKGLEPNMVITALNERSIRDVSDWRDALERMKPGSSVKLDVLAGSQVVYFFLKMPAGE